MRVYIFEYRITDNGHDIEACHDFSNREEALAFVCGFSEAANLTGALDSFACITEEDAMDDAEFSKAIEAYE